MIFNSLDFAIFLPVVFFLYWFAVSSLRNQNILLIVASYFFYGWWDYRFLFLIGFSTILDFAIGVYLEKEESLYKRKLLLLLSIVVNLGFLGFFKYYNFFIENFIASFSFFGVKIPINSLNIVLPVGISFYTFQTLSYSIDVYKRKINATKDFIAFSAFVCFFPQLVAGPIERASQFLKQFEEERKFDYQDAVLGLRQMLWGFFKKIVIADNCARYVNVIFDNPESFSGSTLLVGACLFSFQIYGDFSGYSDIAIGSSRLFGLRLMNNFAYPYFSRDVAEFWRRWHISLSTWFRDYLYIPIGGSYGSKWQQFRNVLIIFLVSGLWHGANWTYLLWGGINAVCFIPLMIGKKNRVHLDVVASKKLFPNIKEFLQMFYTFFITTVIWVFFRAENISKAFKIMTGIFRNSLLEIPSVRPTDLFFLIFVFVLIEWFGRKLEFPLQNIPFKRKEVRWVVYSCLVMVIVIFSGKQEKFIYFQF